MGTPPLQLPASIGSGVGVGVTDGKTAKVGVGVTVGAGEHCLPAARPLVMCQSQKPDRHSELTLQVAPKASEPAGAVPGGGVGVLPGKVQQTVLPPIARGRPPRRVHSEEVYPANSWALQALYVGIGVAGEGVTPSLIVTPGAGLQKSPRRLVLAA